MQHGGIDVVSKRKLIKYIIIVLIPFIVDYGINIMIGYGFEMNSDTIMNASDFIMAIWKYVCLLYWFWVGTVFANLMKNKYLGFMLGNIVWLVLFCLYVWQFCYVGGESRNMLIAMISQNYILGFVSWGAKIIDLFTNTINGTTIVIVAYIIMLVIFTGGYITKLMYLRKSIAK